MQKSTRQGSETGANQHVRPVWLFVAATVALALALVPIVAERGPCAFVPCDPAPVRDISDVAVAWVRIMAALALVFAGVGGVLSLRRRRRRAP